MEGLTEITGFMERAERDARLGPMHISLYLAIIYSWIQQGGEEFVSVTGRELMPIAKIGGLTPMYKCLRELHEYGYIEYWPSHNQYQKSRVYLTLLATMRYRRKA
jgi:hypothetical protein